MNSSKTLAAAIVGMVNFLYKTIMVTFKRLGLIMIIKAQSNPTKAPQKQPVNKALRFKLHILVKAAGE